MALVKEYSPNTHAAQAVEVPKTFGVVSREITRKTTVHDVCLNDKAIATAGKLEAAQHMAAYFEEHAIHDLMTYRALPHKIKLAFISATSQIEPRF